MKAIRTWKYLTLLAVAGFWSCSSSQQMTTNSGSDDLYGTSADAPATNVAANSNRFNNRSTDRFNRRSGNNNQLNTNPDYTDSDLVTNEQNLAYSDDYYSDLSARKVTDRGIAADPGWSDSYNSGFSNGYNTALASSYSGWNTWGWNNLGLYGGLGMGLGFSSLYGGGLGGFYSPFYSSFYSPFSYGYSPFGYGLYSSFWGSPYSYYGGLYSPYGLGYGGYGYGGLYGVPVAVNNPSYDLGAGRRTVGARSSYSSNGYNGNFVNTARGYSSTSGARVAGGLNAANNTRSGSYYSGNSANNAYYSNSAAGRGPRNNGNYYYNNNSNSINSSRSGNNSSLPRYNNAASAGNANTYYSNSGRGVPSGYSNNNSRYNSLQQSQSRSYQAPTYNQPSFQNQSRGFSQPSQSFGGSSRGFSGGGGGFSGGGGHSMGGGGGRGPR